VAGGEEEGKEVKGQEIEVKKKKKGNEDEEEGCRRAAQFDKCRERETAKMQARGKKKMKTKKNQTG